MGEKSIGEIRVEKISESGMGSVSDKLIDKQQYLREQAMNNKKNQEEQRPKTNRPKDPKKAPGKGEVYIVA